MRFGARTICLLTLAVFCNTIVTAAPNRITRSVDQRRTARVAGNVHPLARGEYDRGAADASFPMEDILLMARLSPAQQADLDALLADQQNPSSPRYHQWLTPEEFGARFGLSAEDESKVVAWLNSTGLTVRENARGKNWIRFRGTAGQVSSALRTSIHQYQVDGKMHFANASEPLIPEALADVIEGFAGLNDFEFTSHVQRVPEPAYNSGSNHFMSPEDFATIYNLGPLYQAGLDGTGTAIAVVGQSNILLSDIRSFRTRYGLPANDPTILLYASPDPGFTTAQIEGNLDVEWAGAIAPKAKIYYIYGANAFTAAIAAVNANVAPILTISYGTCEVNTSPAFYRTFARQANAQGITILASSGDSGGAGCDRHGSQPFATQGLATDFPAVLPEVTAVGGTQFNEGTGNYWAPTNTLRFGSALSYIPEVAWNESDGAGILSTGGGASRLYPRPAWQTGPGVPQDGVRHIPDISLSGALHGGYAVTYLGGTIFVGGTSASSPAMAGVVALLNQYLVSNGAQSQAGLGNLNPRLYRLAQSDPSIFHDIAGGDNIVPCAQGTADCVTGSIGYKTGTGYDMATGLGSIDANALVTRWTNGSADATTLTLTSTPTSGTVNDTVHLAATVAPVTQTSETATGTVDFVFNTTPLGTVTLVNGVAQLDVPLSLLAGTGSALIGATYSGDTNFATSGGTVRVQVRIPTSGVSGVILTGPSAVWPLALSFHDLVWQATLTLREIAGTPAMVTGFKIDGQVQPLAQYFPGPSIPPGGTLTANVVLRGVTAPATRVFEVTGTDAAGQAWTRQATVSYMPLPNSDNFELSVTPLVVAQDPAADPTCQWSFQIGADDTGGFGPYQISQLYVGGQDYTRQIPTIFGTRRFDAFSSQRGKVCVSDPKPPSSEVVFLAISGEAHEISVSFTGPLQNPSTLSALPAKVSLASPSGSSVTKTSLAVELSDRDAAWTATIYPHNRTSSWLSASKLSGVGSGTIELSASAAGFGPGAHHAMLVIQSAGSKPQYVNVPVMFVLGPNSSGMAVTKVVNALSFQPGASPGGLVSVFGTKLSDTTEAATGASLIAAGKAPFSTAGVTATVNGLAAPVMYASPDQLNIQIPYEVGAGPAVLGINNNGQVAGYQFDITASSPGIAADGNGNLAVKPVIKQGAYLTAYVTGAGDVSPAIDTGFAPSAGTSVANLPRPVLPVAATIGGVPAIVQFAGNGTGVIGVIQVNVLVPADAATGNQPLVITVGGVASPPVNIVVETP